MQILVVNSVANVMNIFYLGMVIIKKDEIKLVL